MSVRVPAPAQRRRHYAGFVAMTLVAAGCAGGGQVSSTTSEPRQAVTPTTSAATPATSSTAAPTTPPTTVGDDCAALESTTLTTQIEGTTRAAELVVPPSVSGEQPAPLLILLHGFNGAADRILQLTQMGVLASDAGVVVVAPQGIGDVPTWHYDPADDMGDAYFLDGLLDDLAASPCIDEGNVWIAGFSAGSGYAGIYGCSRAARVTGIVMVAGLPPAICPAESGTEILIVHGIDDPIVPFDGGRQAVGDGAVQLASVPESAAGWGAQAGCNPDARNTVYGEETRSIVATWSDCAGATTVRLVAIEGLGHAWPTGATCATLAAMLRDGDPIAPCFG